MNGFREELISSLSGMNGDITIFDATDKEIEEFIKFVLKKQKWKKWIYYNENNLIKFFTAGHYHFNSKIYKNLIYKISKKTNLQNKLNKSIENNLLRYFN